MKIKKLLSLILCFAMLVTAVITTGCGEKEDETEEKENKSQVVTLNMFIVTEDETTDEQAKAVQLAINEYTLKSLKTKVKINYLKEEEYWQTIEDTILAIEEAALEDAEAEEDVADAADEEVKDAEEASDEEASEEDAAEGEEGKEPEKEVTLDDELDQLIADGDVFLEKPQIDIIVFNDYSKYREYANANKLAPLDEFLSLDAKILKSYIYPTYLEAAKLGTGVTYGIPVNGAIGAYEYFVFDAELCDKYGFNVDTVKDFDDLEGFLSVIKANEPYVIPLNRATAPANYEFFSSEGSPLGVYMQPGEKYVPTTITSLYADEGFLSHYRTINRFKKAGYIPDEINPNARYAVQIREGTIEAPSLWEEQDGRKYRTVIYKTPKLTNANALSGVFAVSSKSTNRAKAMELIKEFNINPELANLLQWGVENVHYFMVDENDGNGTISVINDCGYAMNNNYTGNKYIKYRQEGEPWEFEAQKLQNLDSTLGALAGFNPVLEEKYDVVLANAHAAAYKYYADLISGNGDFDATVEALMDELNDVYSIGDFARFITHRIGGDFYNFAEARNLAIDAEEEAKAQAEAEKAALEAAKAGSEAAEEASDAE